MSTPDPGPGQLQPPKSFLRIEGDPTSWGLTEENVTSAPWLTARKPVALTVVTPLSGVLLLAPRRVGSLLLSPALPRGGWIPVIMQPSRSLYLPTAGQAVPATGYTLSPDVNQQTLQRDILTAMRKGTQLKVGVRIGPSIGTVVLNGAELPFVVLADAQTSQPPAEAPADAAAEAPADAAAEVPAEAVPDATT
jgi:hypothetical protein